MLRNHSIAFLLGFLLDLIFGDPYWMPHPIRLIGNLIGALEKKLNREDSGEALRGGRILVLAVTLLTAACVSLILTGAYAIGGSFLAAAEPKGDALMLFQVNWVGVVVEAILTYYILATKCLKVESMKVFKALKAGDVEGARYAVSMIVGRDTSVLDEIGIAKAAIETVAENTSDGIIAPMLYTAIGGPVLGFLYKSINTMDSMVGYKNDRFLCFGRCAAKLDDVVNYLPSRISAYLMMAAGFALNMINSLCVWKAPEQKFYFSVKDAYRIHKRDSRKHASPNSAQTESTCAGALGIQLAGDATYFGVVHKKPLIGDATRPVEYEDIKRANQLLYGTAILCEGICLVGLRLIGMLL